MPQQLKLHAGPARSRARRAADSKPRRNRRRGQRAAADPSDQLLRDRVVTVRRVIQQVVEQARQRGEACSCDLHAGMTVDELRGLGAGCCDPLFVCPVLDRVRRRVGAS